MFGFILKMFIGLLTSIVNASNHTKCVSLNNHQCMNQPTVINLHPNEYSQGLRHYPFAVNLDRCVGSCNTLDDLSNRVSVLNKTEDLKRHTFSGEGPGGPEPFPFTAQSKLCPQILKPI